MFLIDDEITEYYGGINKFNHGLASPLERFRSSFVNILSALKNAKTELDHFAVLNELEQLILSDMLNIEEQNAFISATENQDLIAKARELNIFVDSIIEKTFSQSILNRLLKDPFMQSSNPVLQSYLQRFDSIAKQEILLSNMKETDRVLFIGGGAFPITSINYVRYANADVSCVERIPEVKATADQVVSSLKLENKLHVILEDGQKINCSSFDVIIVGVLARPKKAIIENILLHAKKNARVLCRTTFGVRSAFCPPLLKEDVLSLRPKKSIIATGNQTLSTILFEIPDSASARDPQNKKL